MLTATTRTLPIKDTTNNNEFRSWVGINQCVLSIQLLLLPSHNSSSFAGSLCQRFYCFLSRPEKCLPGLIARAWGQSPHVLSPADGASTIPNHHHRHNHWYYLWNVQLTDSEFHHKLHNLRRDAVILWLYVGRSPPSSSRPWKCTADVLARSDLDEVQK